MRPVIFGALHHGDNVLMAHKKGGAERWVAARQSDEHAVTHKLKAALCHNMRVGSAHMRLQSVKARVVAPVVYGIAADGGREPCCRALGVNVRILVLVYEKRSYVCHYSCLSSR